MRSWIQIVPKLHDPSGNSHVIYDTSCMAAHQALHSVPQIERSYSNAGGNMDSAENYEKMQISVETIGHPFGRIIFVRYASY
jgi:hypothetical protein